MFLSTKIPTQKGSIEMSATSVFELKEKQTAQAFEAYHELRVSLGSETGEPPSTETIDKILTAAGKSWSDLQQDVQRHQRRLSVRAEMQAIEAAKARKAELTAEIQKQNEAFEELRKQHEEALTPLRVEISQIDLETIFEFEKKKEFASLRWPEFEPELEVLRSTVERTGGRARAAVARVAKADADLYTARSGGEKMRIELNLPEPAELEKRLKAAKDEAKQAQRAADDAVNAYEIRLAKANAM